MDINQKAYALLVQMGKTVKQGEAALAKAKEATQGAYTVAVEAALLCKDWPEFEATIDALIDNIRKNVGNLAVSFGAQKRDRASKAGYKYKVPQSVSNARSELKKAFENGVNLAQEDGKPRAFREIADENKAIAELKRAEAAKNLTGLPKARHEALEMLAKLQDWLKADARTESELQFMTNAIRETIAPPKPEAAPKAETKATKPRKTKTKKSAGEALAEAA